MAEKTWLVISCTAGSADLSKALEGGWEPFAVTDSGIHTERPVIWLRMAVTEDSNQELSRDA